MCSCEPGFTCSRCAGTPFDPRYEEDAHEPLTVADFDALALPRGGETERWV